MKREDLKALELTDEQIDQIMALHGKDLEKGKADLATANASATTLQKQLDDANAAIEGFKKLDVEGVKKAADDWKAQAEKAKADAAAEVARLKFDHALDGALVTAKAKNVTAVKALLKADDLKLSEDGTIKGLDDQLTALKKSNAFLFEAEDGTKPPPTIVAGGQPPSTTADPLWAAMLKGSGLKEPTA
jgi:predicted phage tail protein